MSWVRVTPVDRAARLYACALVLCATREVRCGWSAGAVTSNQIYTGIGLILVLAVACQLLGKVLRIPSLILLLPAGFTAGALTNDVNPNDLIGPAFQPLVALSVAVILYDAGL